MQVAAFGLMLVINCLSTVRARPGRLSALRDFRSKSGSCGAFVWAHTAPNGPNRRFSARTSMPVTYQALGWLADVLGWLVLAAPHLGGFVLYPARLAGEELEEHLLIPVQDHVVPDQLAGGRSGGGSDTVLRRAKLH